MNTHDGNHDEISSMIILILIIIGSLKSICLLLKERKTKKIDKEEEKLTPLVPEKLLH